MNHMVFRTEGDWDSTTLYNNEREVPAAQLFVELHAGRDEYNDPASGGVGMGGEMSAYVRAQDNPEEEQGIFPGVLEMQFPGHSVVVENRHPTFDFEATRVWYNGRDVTDSVMDVYVDVNAVDNVVQASIVLFKPHLVAADEVVTYNIL